MLLRNTPTAYGLVSRFFHWTIFVLLALMLTGGYFLGDVPKDYQPFIYNLHKLTGLLILTLMLLRTLWALTNIKPAPLPGTPAWQGLLERVVHLALYVTVIAMPLFGWAGAVAGGRPPHLGDFMFNLPIEQNKAIAKACFEMHGEIAIAIIVLASVHILAALYHAVIKKDGVLKRMW